MVEVSRKALPGRVTPGSPGWLTEHHQPDRLLRNLNPLFSYKVHCDLRASRTNRTFESERANTSALDESDWFACGPRRGYVHALHLFLTVTIQPLKRASQPFLPRYSAELPAAAAAAATQAAIAS